MIQIIKVSLLSLWLGAALLFSAVVAPAAFSVLRQQFNLVNANEIAGTIVSRTLGIINISGFIIGLVMLVATVLSLRSTDRQEIEGRSGATHRGLRFMVQVLALVVLTGATAAGQWVVAARMLGLRAAMMVPIDRIPLDDPQRLVFNQLHGYSVALLSSAMVAAIVAIALSAERRGSVDQERLTK